MKPIYLLFPDSDEERKYKTDIIIANLTKGDQKHYCLAAFDNRTMVGVIYLERMAIDKRAACHIKDLWVRADYRRCGIAKRLKELSWAKQMGSEFTDSNVRTKNEKMIQLNKQLGYAIERFNL